MWRVAVGGPHGDRSLGVTRVVDRHGKSELGWRLEPHGERAVAGIPCRHHDDDPGTYELVHFHAQRASPAREPFGLELVTDAHIDAMDAHPVDGAAVYLTDVGQRPDHPVNAVLR